MKIYIRGEDIYIAKEGVKNATRNLFYSDLFL
jgi:hypothetical protein